MVARYFPLFTARESLQLPTLHVEAGDLEAGFVEEQRAGQADLPLADDADVGAAVEELCEKSVFLDSAA
jgi:hypothetical protein